MISTTIVLSRTSLWNKKRLNKIRMRSRLSRKRRNNKEGSRENRVISILSRPGTWIAIPIRSTPTGLNPRIRCSQTIHRCNRDDLDMIMILLILMPWLPIKSKYKTRFSNTRIRLNRFEWIQVRFRFVHRLRTNWERPRQNNLLEFH